MFSLRGRPRKLKKSVKLELRSQKVEAENHSFEFLTSYFLLLTSLCAARAPAAAGGLRVRIVEHEALADHVGVVLEHGAVQEEQALALHDALRARAHLEHLVS